MIGIVYANISSNLKYALGYLNWYDITMPITVTKLFKNNLQKRTDAISYLKDCNFHFAARIRKTHHVSIPLDVIYMKLKHFIKEQLEIRENKLHPKMIQLEFDFVKENASNARNTISSDNTTNRNK